MGGYPCRSCALPPSNRPRLGLECALVSDRTGISPLIVLLALAVSCGDDGGGNGMAGVDPGMNGGGTADAGSKDTGEMVPMGPPPRSLTARVTNVVRGGDVSGIPQQYQDASPFEGLEVRVDALDALQNGGLRFVVLPPFADEGGQWEGPNPGPGGGRIELSTAGCSDRCQPVAYDLPSGDGALVFGSFTFDQAIDPEGAGWSPGTTGTLFAEERYDGEGVSVQATVTLSPDTTAPMARFVPDPRGFVLPWEGTLMRYSEPVDGRGLAGFSLMGAGAPQVIALATRLEEPALDDNVIGADVRVVSGTWPEGTFTVAYAGGDLDAAGNMAGPATGTVMDVAAPAAVTGIDFEDAAADPLTFGPEEMVPGSVCNGGNRCKAIELFRPSTVGLYFRIATPGTFGSVNIRLRHLAEVCTGPGAWARLSASVHQIGRAPGNPEDLDTVIGEPANAPLGFSCDSGWVSRSINVGSASDIGILLEISRSGNSSSGRRIILIDDITAGN